MTTTLITGANNGLGLEAAPIGTRVDAVGPDDIEATFRRLREGG